LREDEWHHLAGDALASVGIDRFETEMLGQDRLWLRLGETSLIVSIDRMRDEVDSMFLLPEGSASEPVEIDPSVVERMFWRVDREIGSKDLSVERRIAHQVQNAAKLLKLSEQDGITVRDMKYFQRGYLQYYTDECSGFFTDD
jgi:hypothetical protein